MVLDQCCSCSELRNIQAYRIVGGFAEYVITHNTTNPVTYLTGRRYRTAQLSFEDSPIVVAHCGGAAMTIVPKTPGVGRYWTGNYTEISFAVTSEYAALTQVPSLTKTGQDINEATPAFGFYATGYYEIYFGAEDPYVPSGGGIGYGLQFGVAALQCNSPACGPDNTIPDVINSFISYYDLTDGVCCDENPDDDKSYSCSFFYKDNESCQSFGSCPTTAPNECDYDQTSGCAGYGLEVTSNYLNPANWHGQGGMAAEGYQCSLFLTDGCPQCKDFWNFQFEDETSVDGYLTNEVDYDGLRDSIADAMAFLRANANYDPTGAGCANSDLYKFNDWPVQDYGGMTGDLGDPGTITGYDGSLMKDCNLAPTGIVCNAPNSMAYYFAIPTGVHPGEDANYYIGTPDDPGYDHFETYLWNSQSQGKSLLPGVMATFILMNDGSKILETRNDMSARGVFWCPIPDCNNFNSVNYGTYGDGELKCPVGRITLWIEGKTGDEWDGSYPG